MLYLSIVVLLILALLQGALMPTIPLLGIRPDLILVLLLAWTMVRGVREGVVGAFIAGLALDVFSSYPLGSHSLVLALTVLAVGWLEAPVYRENLAFPIIGTAAATLLYNLLLMGLSQLLGQPVAWGSLLWRFILPLALLEAAMMPLAYWFADRMDQRLTRRMRFA